MIAMDQRRARDARIDLYKALLIVAMIFSHTIGFFGNRDISLLLDLKRIVELLVFPGLLLCFGYSSQIAYFSVRPLNYQRILRAALRLLVAFYISAIGYVLFLEPSTLSGTEFGRILTLSRIPFVSEFMLNFPLTLLVATVFIRPISWVLEKGTRLLIVIGLLLGTALFPYALVTSPQLGLLIGTPRTVFYSFPVVQYFPFFLIGLFLARHQIRYSRWLMAASLISISLGLILFQIIGYPLRFPPALGWIGISIVFAISGYFLVQYLPIRSKLGQLFIPIGVNSLNFFLLSNLFLFALRSRFPTLSAGIALCALIALTIIGVIYFITTTSQRTVRSAPEETRAVETASRLALSPAQEQILHTLNNGAVLKAERDLDGRKDFVLYTPDGSSRFIARDVLEPLFEHSLIDSNKKFPAATFWLTEAGRARLA